MAKYPGEPVDFFNTRSSTAAERKAKRNAELRANWRVVKPMPASQRREGKRGAR